MTQKFRLKQGVIGATNGFTAEKDNRVYLILLPDSGEPIELDETDFDRLFEPVPHDDDIKSKQYRYHVFFNCSNEHGFGFACGNMEFTSPRKISEPGELKKIHDFIKQEANVTAVTITNWKRLSEH